MLRNISLLFLSITSLLLSPPPPPLFQKVFFSPWCKFYILKVVTVFIVHLIINNFHGTFCMAPFKNQK